MRRLSQPWSFPDGRDTATLLATSPRAKNPGKTGAPQQLREFHWPEAMEPYREGAAGEHRLSPALGSADGQKDALGLWEGSTENVTLC